MKNLYADANATIPPHPRVIAAMMTSMSSDWGNPSSSHFIGRKVRQMVDSARNGILTMLGESNHELVFTSGGTEANNLAIHSALAAHQGRYIITTEIEHPSVLSAMRQAQVNGRREVVFVRTRSTGEIDLEHLSATLAHTSGETSLVSLMWANNESGVLQPVHKACELAHSAGALFHTDAVQAAGKTRVSLASLSADYVTVSAHKFGGPMGIGAMIFPRSFRRIKPLLFGGGQEKGARGGTENVPGIVGMGEAAKLSCEKLQTPPGSLARDSFELGITALFPPAVVLGANAPRVPNTSLLRMPGVNGLSLVRKLDRLGVAIATGSACHSGSISPSKSLIAMGLEETAAREVVRISFLPDATIDDVTFLLDSISVALGIDHEARDLLPPLNEVAEVDARRQVQLV